MALETYYGDAGVPYYSLIHKGVRFNEYVGVIQVGDIIIEVLPKADKSDNEEKWRGVLIGMLKAIGSFDTQAPSSASLNLKSNSILDLYFSIFISEAEQLLHKGLVKRYNKTEGNAMALKGSIQFAKHFQKNAVHAERFYIRYTTYNQEHSFNQILYKTLLLLRRINRNPSLHSRIGALLLNFPEMKGIKVDEALFDNLTYNRKTEPYRKAMNIARLLLLNHHPDVTKGRNDVLALMFDMNLLWEKFVLASLERFKPLSTTIHSQSSKSFWKPEKGSKSRLRPDIVINKDKDDCLVLDTKWKNLGGSNPSADDLQQLYAYHKFYKAKRAALIYPADLQACKRGSFFNENDNEILAGECVIIKLCANPDIWQWQKQIADAAFVSQHFPSYP
jgi:5-methylcytosine-specific restriction enzyme subunit McrC